MVSFRRQIQMRRHLDSVPGRQPLATKFATVLFLLVRQNSDSGAIEWVTSRLAEIRHLPIKSVALIHKCIATAVKLPILKALAKLVATHIQIAYQAVEYTVLETPPTVSKSLEPALQQARNRVSFYIGVLLANGLHLPIPLLKGIATSRDRRIVEVYCEMRRALHSA